MRNIRKREEPATLVNYQAQLHATFEGLPSSAKQELCECLLEEQGYICCYCMSRIKRDSMKTEHWHCRSGYSGEQLDYRNMLAACYGNEGYPPRAQHCDTRKGNSDLALNPANPQHDVESRVKYLGNGTIESTNTAFNDQIDNVLNLNFSRLKGNRREVVVAVEQVLNEHPGTRTRSQIERLISQWNSVDGDGKLKPFNAVAIYFLKKRLSRA